jgi:DtxR family Mn-dependent transcriptional regulator
MARRLVETGLVDYRKYYGVRLTPEGEAIALKVIRRHRLIELYLVEELGYALREVHNDAEDLEHVVSDHFMAAIDSKLGHPQIDPHGDPIPSVEGVITRRDLTDHPCGVGGHSQPSGSSNQDVLQHILERGFELGASVIDARDPSAGGDGVGQRPEDRHRPRRRRLPRQPGRAIFSGAHRPNRYNIYMA